KQKVVVDAAKELRDRGIKAFPDLVKVVDDKRYSCLKMGDEEESRHALSVGDMAWSIIHVQVDACLYAKELGYGETMPSSVPFERENDDVKKWFEPRKSWSLNQFQLEAIRWYQKHHREEWEYWHKTKLDADGRKLIDQLEALGQQLSKDKATIVL